MPLVPSPTFTEQPRKMFEISTPCSGGLNLHDLPFKQEVDQSPTTLNMLYRNGVFGKRYGQANKTTFENTIYAVGEYGDDIFVHSGTKVYKGIDNPAEIASGIAEKKGIFINFNRNLYYICDKYYVYSKKKDTDVYEWKEVDPYVPDLVINRKPDGSYSDVIESYNMIGAGFKNTFHGDGTSVNYILTSKGDDLENTTPVVWFDVEDDDHKQPTTAYTFDKTNGKVTFNTAPASGTNNVIIKAFYSETKTKEYKDKIMASKYWINFGGNNNSRLFLAGGGESIYYYSEAFDASYFPENNYASIGNGESDITGFGEQYNVLIIFKPKEMFSLAYYVLEDGNTSVDTEEGKGAFTSQLVNAKIGCDCPYSIQLINNQLVWLSTDNGVCTLVSTNIEDERNVRLISRNINGGYRENGLLQEANLKEAVSIDWDNKYWLTINGKVYLWDYLLTPYANTGKLEQDAKRLAWYLFDNFFVTEYFKDGEKLLYYHGKNIVELNNSFNDFGQPIHAIYQTPLFQFENEAYLKNVHKIYVQCRADTSSKINMKYITNDNAAGEIENEPIFIGSKLWKTFKWSTFQWTQVSLAKVFMRKCALKKIEMAGVYFENNQLDCDMSISYLGFEFSVVKTIK